MGSTLLFPSVSILFLICLLLVLCVHARIRVYVLCMCVLLGIESREHSDVFQLFNFFKFGTRSFIVAQA